MERYRINLEDVRDRAVAAFLSFAVGDAMGATAEFMTPGEIQAQYGVLDEIRGGGWLRLPVGAVTDDTEMSVCVARSIVAEGFSPLDIATRFADWLKTKPRDVGATCRRGIRRFLTDGSVFAKESDMDGGNGAAMRMTPIAIATVGDSNALVRWAIEQAHITHHQDLSDAACVLIGQMIQLALVGHGKSRIRFLVDDFLLDHPAFAFEGRTLHCSAYVVDTLRIVLSAFFSTRNLEECLVTTVNWGGDADTAGAIAGAIAGAYYGLEGIPERWLKKLDARIEKEVRELAAQLVARSPVALGTGALHVARKYLREAVRSTTGR